MAVKYCDYASGADFTGQTNWAVGQFYPTNTFLIGKSGGSYTRVVYRCTADHTSANDTEPGVGVDWATVWEVYADGTWDHPYKTITDASTAAGAGANEVRCKASPADTAIGGSWNFTDNSKSVTCTDGVDHSGDVAAKDIIGNATVGWWEVDSVAYADSTTTITLVYNWAHADGRPSATSETIVKRGVTEIAGVSSTAAQTMSVNGTSKAAMFKVSGGWIADGVQGDGFSSGQQTTFHNSSATRVGYGLSPSSCAKVEKVHFSRWQTAMRSSGTQFVAFVDINISSTANEALYPTGPAYLENVAGFGCSSGSSWLASSDYSIAQSCKVISVGNVHRSLQSKWTDCYFRNIGITGVWAYATDIVFKNCHFGGYRYSNFPRPGCNNTSVRSYNENGVAGNHRVDQYFGYYMSQTTRRHTESGIAWTMYPNSNSEEYSRSGTNFGMPLEMSVAQVAVAADAQVTATVWVKKSNAAGTFEARLICKGEQLAGVASDVTDVADDTTDWQQLQVQCTPTEAGVLEFHVQVWGSSSYYVDVDDFAVSQ